MLQSLCSHNSCYPFAFRGVIIVSILAHWYNPLLFFFLLSFLLRLKVAWNMLEMTLIGTRVTSVIMTFNLLVLITLIIICGPSVQLLGEDFTDGKRCSIFALLEWLRIPILMSLGFSLLARLSAKSAA